MGARQQHHDRADPEGQGGQVNLIAGGPGRHHDGVDVVAARNCVAQQMFELAEADDECCGRGEAADDRVRQEIHHEAQPQHAHRQLQRADHQRQEERVADECFATDRRDRGHASGDEQRHHRHRADRELARGAEHGVDRQRHERGVEAVDGRQTREHRVGHALGNQHDRGGEAGDGVAAELTAVVAADGAHDGGYEGHAFALRISHASK